MNYFKTFGYVLVASLFFSVSNIVLAYGLQYRVGSNPVGVAFDNVTNSIWVTNNGSGTVSKVNVNTGIKIDYSVGLNPYGVAFDNLTNSVWVTNFSSSTISKINIYTGERNDYRTGDGPRGVAFDNVTNSIWVANFNANSVSKVDINTGTKVDYVVGKLPLDVTFDNLTNSVWVANFGSSTVSKVDVTTGLRADYVVGGSPSSLTFDNITRSVWVAVLSGYVSKMNINTGARTDYWVGGNLQGVAFDNATNSLWVTSPMFATVSKIDIMSGTRTDYRNFTSNTGVAFDNVTNSIWVTNSTESSVSKINVFSTTFPVTTPPVFFRFPSQYISSNMAQIMEGDTTSESSVTFQANLWPNFGLRTKLQVELKPFNQLFDGTALLESVFGAYTTGIIVKNLIPEGAYHWRARAVSERGDVGVWREFNTAGNVDFEVKASSTPLACTVNCYSNVLFLPGLEASRLYRPDYSGGTDQLWEPTSDTDAGDLFLDVNGNSVRNDVYTKDVIDQAYSGGPNIYQSFIGQMNDLKTAGTITDWKATPYDWRLSLDDILNNGTELSGRVYYSGTLAATSSPYIIQELKRLAKTSKTGKVAIVAHSNGGLLAKALTNKLGAEAANLIDKIIFVAVPQVGTPQAVGALLHGYEQGLPKDWLSIFLSQSTARTLGKNMPSAYNLLPSASYFTTAPTSVATFADKPILAEFRARYGDEIKNVAQLKTFITDSWRLASSTPSDIVYPSVGNDILFDRAETTHTTLDSWTPPAGVQLYEIAGWGEDTLATVEYKQGNKTVHKEVQAEFPFTGTYWVNVIEPTIIYDPKEVIDGDGTVLAPSALWTATATTTGKWWVDLWRYNNERPQSLTHLDSKHADILEVPSLRTFIQNILTNSPLATLPDFITSYQPPSDVAINRRLSFILHSPLNLSATDSLGNITNSATSTIPGSKFTQYGEVQVLKVSKGTPITLNLTGYASGSFTLDIQELDGLNNITASTTFSAIPSATSTTAAISFPNGTLETATPLLVDYDNNGIADFTLRPSIGKEVVFDIAPPEVRVSFSTSTKRLIIEGIDESPTTIQTTATSTTLTDESSNTLEFIFRKFKQENHELHLQLQTLSYNGVSTSQIPKTTLQYEWSTDTQGNLKELEQTASTETLRVEAHYDAKKNETKIEKKLKEKNGEEDKEIKETFSGLRILKLVTDKGVVKIDY